MQIYVGMRATRPTEISMIKDGYKDTEIGVIPIEWDVVKLNEICKFKQGIQIPLEEQYTTQINDTIRFLRISDYTQSTADIRFVSNDYSDYIISSNDVIMVRYGETAGFIGTNLSGVLANNLFSINPNEKIIKKYLYTYMNDEKIYNYLKSLRAAGAMPAVSFKSLNVIKIPLPPLKEQEKIADVLSTADDKIDTISTQIEKAETLKKGLLQKLLSEGIGHSVFKDSELGKIPESWEIVKLDDIAKINMGQSPKSVTYNEDNIGMPLIQGNADCKNRKTVPRTYTSAPTKLCFTNDIIMTVRAPVGAIVKSLHNACIGRGVCAIRAKEDNTFLYHLLVDYEDKWDKLSQGSTFTAVNSNDVRNIKLQFPPLEEQKQIADILSTADEKLEVLRAKKEKFETLKKGLLQKLLSGEIRVGCVS